MIYIKQKIPYRAIKYFVPILNLQFLILIFLFTQQLIFKKYVWTVKIDLLADIVMHLQFKNDTHSL